MTGKRASKITDADLMAYLDRSLDAARVGEIESALATDAEARTRLAIWQQQNALIANLYQPAATEPLPPSLNVRRMAAERKAVHQGWQRMAAAVILSLGIGAGGGWYLGNRSPGAGRGALPVQMTAALTAYRLYAGEVAHPVDVSGNPSGELGAWLSKRLDRTLRIPDLHAAGWALVGGSLLPAGDKPGAQIMYEDAAGRRLTLFFTPVAPRKDDTPRFATAAGLDMMSWTDASLNCTIVAPIGRANIKLIAADVYEQMT
ncbi:MAG TPA: anti-sigma factor [Acidisoma sp.]|uniref:anti-sigma factor family protein n=1 Tax=Acidisoma sp. TaxID=1872115 RepID=UPI002C18DBDD|nr:anti-sigma factor [Acidisoma sp.]HTI03430.1 anti-sigma factor [Acidisoma sp.]